MKTFNIALLKKISEHYYLAILIMFPVFFLLRKPDFFFNPLEYTIDPWVYTGYFFSFPEHLRDFTHPQTYYGDRLPWIIPGYVLHRLFSSPVVANTILHLSFFYVLLFSAYALGNISGGKRHGFLMAIMLGGCPLVIQPMQWDYIDGIGITCIVLILCLLTLTAQHGHWVYPCLAGATFAALIWTNLFLTSLIGVFGVYYFTFTFRGKKRWLLHSFACGAGFLTFTVGIALIKRHYGGAEHLFFFKRTLNFLLNFSKTNNPWRPSNVAWLPQAFWLVLPVLGFIHALIIIIFRKRRLSFSSDGMFLPLQYTAVAAFILWTLFELSGQPVLSTYYYSSYFLPLMLFALCVSVSEDLGKFTERGFLVMISGVLLFLFILGISDRYVLKQVLLKGFNTLYRGGFIRPISPDQIKTTGLVYNFIPGFDLSRTVIAFLIGLLGIIGVSILHSPRVKTFTLLCALSIVYTLTPMFGWVTPQAEWNHNETLKVVADIHRHIQHIRYDKRPVFWYSKRDQLYSEFRGLTSTFLWNYSLINEDFPDVTVSQIANLTSGNLVVLLQSHPKSLEETSELFRDWPFTIQLLEDCSFILNEREVFVEIFMVQDTEKN